MTEGITITDSRQTALGSNNFLSALQTTYQEFCSTSIPLFHVECDDLIMEQQYPRSHTLHSSLLNNLYVSLTSVHASGIDNSFTVGDSALTDFTALHTTENLF